MHHADPPLHLLFSALLLSAGLASCKRVVTTTTTTTYPDTGGDEADTDTDPVPAGAVRFVHLSPDGERIDMLTDRGGGAWASSLSFPSDSGQVDEDIGQVEAFVVPAGGTVDDGLASATFELDQHRPVTVVAYDSWSNLRVKVLEDDGSAIKSSETRFRLAHLAGDGPTVDVWNLTDDELLIDDFSFGADELLDVKRDVDELGIDWNGDATMEIRFDLDHSAAGERLDLILANYEGGTPLFLYLLTEDGTGERVDAQ